MGTTLELLRKLEIYGIKCILNLVVQLIGFVSCRMAGPAETATTIAPPPLIRHVECSFFEMPSSPFGPLALQMLATQQRTLLVDQRWMTNQPG